MNARRVEVTFSQKDWDRLEKARGREPRASFVKRALEPALGGVEAFASEQSEHSPLDHSVSAPVRAPVDPVDEFAAGEVMDPDDVPDRNHPSRAARVPDLMWDRQAKLNKRGKK